MIRIRKCTSDDAVEVQQIGWKAYQETFAAMNSKETMDAYRNEAFKIGKITDELLNPASCFYFVEVERQLAGCLKVNESLAQTELQDPLSLEVERIYVLQAFQKMGLGRRLMDQAMEFALEKGKKYLWLGVWEKNCKAIQFYKKLGFVRIGIHDFVMGDEIQKDYLMRKDLVG